MQDPASKAVLQHQPGRPRPLVQLHGDGPGRAQGDVQQSLVFGVAARHCRPNELKRL